MVSWNSFPIIILGGFFFLYFSKFSKIFFSIMLYEFVRVAQKHFSFPSLLYLPTFHPFSTFPFPSFTFPNCPTFPIFYFPFFPIPCPFCSTLTAINLPLSLPYFSSSPLISFPNYPISYLSPSIPVHFPTYPLFLPFQFLSS